MQSIIDTAKGIDISKADYSLLQASEEFALIKKISLWDDVIWRAKEELAPHLISKFCFDLSQLVNNYYAHVKILTDDEKIKIARIALLEKVLQTLKQAMELIGMIFVDRM